jgi:quercetin dioxygenase-like cupin family protein
MKFTLQNAKQFGWEGVKGFECSNKNDFPNVSIVYAEVNGRHGKIRNIKSDRVYIVFDGEGEFILNDEVIPVQKMDVIIVPKNTPYDYRGNMKIFLVDLPAFEEGADIKLE